MKFSVVALATVASASVVERDFAPYKKVLDAVGSGISNLDSAVNSYSGDKKPLLDASDALVKAISSGKTTVDGLDPLTDIDATGLVAPVTDLNTKGDALVADLKKKRDTVSKAGECATVRKSVADINTNSQALIKSVIGKVPPAFQALAAQLAGKLTTTLNQASDDFSEANCKDSTGGGSSSAAPPASSSAAPPASSSAAPSGGSSSAKPTGSATPTPTPTPTPSGTKPPTVPTAGAAAFAPAGALAMAVAALIL